MKNNNLYAREQWFESKTIDLGEDGWDTQLYSLGVSDFYKTKYDKKGDLFKACQRYWGKCVSKVYQDTSGGIIAIGWVFQKREPYQDDNSQSYMRETWVTVHEKPPTVTKEYHYA